MQNLNTILNSSNEELANQGVTAGIFICKDIVSLSGGKISVTNSTKNGTSVSFTFDMNLPNTDISSGY